MERNTHNEEGIRVAAAVNVIENLGLRVIVQIPTEEAFAPIGVMIRQTLWMALVACLLSITLAWFLARILVVPIMSVVRASQELAEGHLEKKAEVRTNIREIVQLGKAFNTMAGSLEKDITERKQAQEQIQASLEEKELLLKEIHHRVKNNLQIISSLLNLQSAYLKEPQSIEQFKESQFRVRAMALVHEKLYQSKNLARIDFGSYTRDLTTNLLRVYRNNSNTVSLDVIADDIALDIDTAIPMGLIINELITNSLKFAFPAGQRGKISIELRRDDGHQVTLLFRDNGMGLEKDLDFRNTESLGLQLVNALTKQLDGTIELDTKGGTAFKITFAEIKSREVLKET